MVRVRSRVRFSVSAPRFAENSNFSTNLSESYENPSNDFQYFNFQNQQLNKLCDLGHIFNNSQNICENGSKCCECSNEINTDHASATTFDLKVVGILYNSQLKSSLTSTQKLLLAILTNLSKSSRSSYIDFTNNELLDRSNGLFKRKALITHLNALQDANAIYVQYSGGIRYITVPDVQINKEKLDSHKKPEHFTQIYNIANVDVNASDILVFSHVLDKCAFHAKAGLDYISDNLRAANVCKTLGMSDRTLRNSFNNLKSKNLFVYCDFDAHKDIKHTVKAVMLSESLKQALSEQYPIAPSADARKCIIKRLKESTSLSKEELEKLDITKLQSLLLKFSTSKKFKKNSTGKNRNNPQGVNGNNRNNPQPAMVKNETYIYKEVKDKSSNDVSIKATSKLLNSSHINQNEKIGINYKKVTNHVENRESYFISGVANESIASRLGLDIDLLLELISINQLSGLNLQSAMNEGIFELPVLNMIFKSLVTQQVFSLIINRNTNTVELFEIIKD